jgi:hypothetical protein
MRTLTLIASVTLMFTIFQTGCEPGGAPDPGTDPLPYPPYTAADGGPAPPDYQAPPAPAPTTPPPPAQPGANCAPVGSYSGAATGSVDANIPLLGPQKMPVECQVKFTVQGSGSTLKAVGTVQVIDPQTKKPWVYAPKPFTFTADVKCTRMAGPLKGNISALGLQVAFDGSMAGTWDGAAFKGMWNGSANTGVTAKGFGPWNAKP